MTLKVKLEIKKKIETIDLKLVKLQNKKCEN